MSKEIIPLEALERIRSHNYHEHNKKECLSIIETALKENEYLKTELLGQSQELNIKNKALEIIKKELMLEVKDDNGLYRLITYQSDNHLIRKDQYELLKEVLLWV